MPWDEKLAYFVNALFGGAVGALIHAFALGGFVAHLRGRAHWWNGTASFLILATIGAVVGLISYHQRHREYNLPLAGVYEGSGGLQLLIRRLAAIAGAVVALYFIWQLAKSI